MTGTYLSPLHPAKAGEGPERAPAEAGAQPISSRREHRPRKPYKKRTPKPAFTPPDESRRAEAVAAVEAERCARAVAEAEQRERRKAG